ncbi:hypothetical protein [Anaerosolibacter sp.]|uniref:hypothetical protein n=1 Tax=Anaerosolibacter sp. TaxID=1872527 RepID=UPI0039EEA761
MKKIVLILLMGIVFLQGCTNIEDHIEWYQSKESAIENGIEKEGLDKSAILSVDEINGETIIFYEMYMEAENLSAFGIAIIKENNNSYSWYRPSAYFGFESTDSDYMLAGTNIKTPRKQEISVVIGRVCDNTIKSVILSGDGQERELVISGKGRLFYSIHKAPFTHLKIQPLR